MLTCGFSGPGDSVGSGYSGEPSESESGPDDKDGQVQESQISLQSAPGQLHVTVYTSLYWVTAIAGVQELVNTPQLNWFIHLSAQISE